MYARETSSVFGIIIMQNISAYARTLKIEYFLLVSTAILTLKLVSCKIYYDTCYCLSH